MKALHRFATGPAKGKELFRTPRVHGEVKIMAYNEWSLLLWAEHMLLTPSNRTGRPLAPNTIASYLSLGKTELAVQYGFDIVANSDKRLQRAVKSMASRSVLRNRRKRRGLRRHHLKRAYVSMGYAEATGKQEVNEWAALTVGREALARGGELCVGSTFDAANPQVPTRGDVTFEHDKHGRTATLWLRPLKKRGKARKDKVPIVFVEGRGGGSSAYKALRMLYRHDPVQKDLAARTPLFRRKGGAAMPVRDLRSLIKRTAAALSLPQQEFGAHSLRIGGATDIGDESPLLLQAKGRWASDIAGIYARLTRRGLVKSAWAMHKRSSRDMEELHSNFVQPV
jgi:hypothetical protein